jgi:N-acetyl-gamma-glutamylphosphate reductase
MKGNIQFITTEVTTGEGYEHGSECCCEMTWHLIAPYLVPKHVVMKELSQRMSEYKQSQTREPQFQLSCAEIMRGVSRNET